MEVSYTKDAFASLRRLVNYIEEKNTAGAGLRWLTKYEAWLLQKLLNVSYIKPCNTITFKNVGLKCIYYNDWVIAFSAHGENILVEAFLHVSRIAD